MVCVSVGRLVVAATAAAAALSAGATSGADWSRDWATLHNDRHGFLIAYPVEVFGQKADPATD